VWKGAEAPEIMVLTGTQVYSNGMMSMSSCDINYSIGTEYVVYASGGPQDLKSHSCSRTAPLQEAEARALDAVTPHKKVGNDVRSCSTDSSSNGEIRLVTSDTNRAAIRAVRIAVERINDRPGVSQFGVVTNTAGKAAITSLPPGEYTITADLDGYSPRRMTVQIKPQACVEASVFLLRVPIRKD
jgi:hypothetical protein